MRIPLPTYQTPTISDNPLKHHTNISGGNFSTDMPSFFFFYFNYFLSRNCSSPKPEKPRKDIYKLGYTNLI